ncbi:MAG: ABC transporter ATP-binding protein [Acidimicrobiia bacterium]
MLEVSGIHTYYGASHVLHGVGLDVRGGELVALLGRNGSGKTTTLMTLAGVLRARSGSVTVDGVDVSGLPSYQRLKHGLTLVPSGARVFADLTVDENLRVVRGRSTDGGDRWTTDQVYEFFPKLGDLRNRNAGNLSGGERQMLAVGRSLMANPKVMLLDEPSEGLAPVMVRAVGELLDQLVGVGLAVVLAEQNHRFALRHADRAFLIEKGEIKHEAPAADLPGSVALQRYLGV